MRYRLSGSTFVVILVLADIFVLLVDGAMTRNLCADEHQFIASAALVAQHGLIPYKDFAYSHTPNLIFAYAAVFQTTDHLLLAGRLFSLTCDCLTLGVIFFLTFNLFRDCSSSTRLGLATGSVIAIVANPVFIFTYGRAWNHGPSILLAVLAFAFHCYAARHERPHWHFFWSGCLIALAIGTRVSFAPAVVPFLWAISRHPQYGKSAKKIAFFTPFLLGAILGSLPTLVLFALSPYQLLWGTLYKPVINIEFFRRTGGSVAFRGFSVLDRAAFFAEVFAETGTALIVVLFSYFAVRTKAAGRVADQAVHFAFRFVLVLLPFLLVSPLITTPCWYQYFCATIPFLVIGTMLALKLVSGSNVQRFDLKLCALAVTMCCVSAIVSVSSDHARRWYSAFDFNKAGEWAPLQIRKLGAEVREAVGDGKILTLTPIYPLEGGLDVYEELAMGMFSWNVSDLIPPGERRELRMIGPGELDQYLKEDVPAGILVGLLGLPFMEQEFIEYAEKHGYESRVLSNGATLWRLPQRGTE